MLVVLGGVGARQLWQHPFDDDLSRLRSRSFKKSELGKLGVRLGTEAVTRFHPGESHVPEKAAQVILQGVRKKRSRIMVGPDTKVLDFLVRMTGSGYQWVVPRVGRLFMKPIR